MIDVPSLTIVNNIQSWALRLVIWAEGANKSTNKKLKQIALVEQRKQSFNVEHIVNITKTKHLGNWILSRGTAEQQRNNKSTNKL